MTRYLHAQRSRDWSPPPFRTPDRPRHDFYPTPPEATRALLSVEQFDGPIWECACGDGAIARELKKAGYQVTATDLVYRGYGTGEMNFLRQTRPLGKHIITNPPYGHGLADEFVRHALHLRTQTGGSVAMLMNITSLCHPTRHDWYCANPPAAIYAIDHIVCYPHGEARYATSRTTEHRYCWMVWRPNHHGKPSLWWLSSSQFREASPSHPLN